MGRVNSVGMHSNTGNSSNWLGLSLHDEGKHTHRGSQEISDNHHHRLRLGVGTRRGHCTYSAGSATTAAPGGVRRHAQLDRRRSVSAGQWYLYWSSRCPRKESHLRHTVQQSGALSTEPGHPCRALWTLLVTRRPDPSRRWGRRAHDVGDTPAMLECVARRNRMAWSCWLPRNGRNQVILSLRSTPRRCPRQPSSAAGTHQRPPAVCGRSNEPRVPPDYRIIRS